jgi:hypothetical protein
MSEEAEVIEEAIPDAPEVPEVEEQARAMGWAPEEDWRGPKEKWVDAQTFVDRGKDRIPVLNERIKNQARQLNEMKATMAEFAGHYSSVQKNAYERAYRDIKQMQSQAVAEGDMQKYAELDSHLEQMRANPPQAPQVAPPNPADDPVYQEWLSENKWYVTDPQLGQYAETIGNYIRTQNPNLHGADFLSEVASEVKKRFPERFGIQSRPVPTVEGARSAAPKPGKGKGYRDLPADAKQACDKFVKQGLLKREDYVRDYFGE